MLELTTAIQMAKNYLGDNYFAALNLSYEPVKDKSELTIIKNGNDVVIKYGELASLFRGLSIIKMKREEQSFEVTYHKNFEHNGLMKDCSRNAVLNLKTAKDYILLSALFGLNRFLLYIEDTYEIKGEPWFGYLRGKYTKEELNHMTIFKNI